MPSYYELLALWRARNAALDHLLMNPEKGLTSWYLAVEKVQAQRNELEVQIKLELAK